MSQVGSKPKCGSFAQRLYCSGWLPVLWYSRNGAVAIVAALEATARAWLTRANYSIDLNNTGYIGYTEEQQPLPLDAAEIIRPVLVKNESAQGLKMLAQEATTFDEAEPPTEPPTRARLWTLPNGIQLPQIAVENFVDGIFIRGWSRAAWVGRANPLEREQYDGLINLLEQTGILIGRKQGAKGKLSIQTPEAARAILKLPALGKLKQTNSQKATSTLRHKYT